MQQRRAAARLDVGRSLSEENEHGNKLAAPGEDTYLMASESGARYVGDLAVGADARGRRYGHDLGSQRRGTRGAGDDFVRDKR